MEDPINLKKKAEVLNQRFYLLLENFKNSYVLHKENVNYNVNKNKFEGNKNDLQNFLKTILLLDNNIDLDTNKLNSFVKETNKTIKKEKVKNKKLTDIYKNIMNGDSTNEQMYDDTKVIYSQRYIHFIVLIIGIVIISFFLYNLYKDEGYELDDTMPFSKKVISIISIILLIIILGTRSMGINIFEPIEDFFTDRGYFNNITLNF